MASKLNDCGSRAVKAGLLTKEEVDFVSRKAKELGTTMEPRQAAVAAARSMIQSGLSQLQSIRQQLGKADPLVEPTIVFRSKSQESALAAMVEETQAFVENKMLGEAKAIAGDQGKVLASEQKAEAALLGTAPAEVPFDMRGKPMPAQGERQAQIEAALERLNKEPSERVSVYQKMRDRVLSLMQEHGLKIAEREFKEGFTIGGSEGLTAAEKKAMGISEAAVLRLDKQKMLSAMGELNAVLKFLPPEIRGKVGGFFELAKGGVSEERLTDFFVKRIAMVERELERSLRKDYLEQIEKLFKPAKKTSAGVPQSRLGADAQRAVDFAKTVSTLNADQTSENLDDRETKLSKTEISAEEHTNLLEEWAILNLFGDLENRTAEELAKAHEYLSNIAKEGRSEWRKSETARLENVHNLVNELIAGIGPATREGLNQQEMGEGAAALIDSYGLSHSSLLQFLARILPTNASFLKSWQDRLRRADNSNQDFGRHASNRLTERLRGISNTRRGVSQLMWNLKQVQPKSVTIAGEKVSMSRLEAIQYLLSWNQPDVRAKMIANDGFTEESAEQMREMTKDEASQAVMGFLREEYDRIYQLANPIYRRMFGMDMPRNDLYAPARFEGGEVGDDISPFGGPLTTSGVTPGALKGRVNHSNHIRQMDALTVYWQHIAEMGQWIHYAEIQRELRGVLSNKDVRRSIMQIHGKSTLQQTETWIDALARQGGNKASELLINQRVLDSLISAKAIASLGFNLRTIFAQNDSMARAVFAMPMRRIAKAIQDPNFFSNIAKAWHSDTIQRRVQLGASPEARYLYERTRLKPSGFLQLGKASMLPMQWVDGHLTGLTAAIVYTDSYNQNKAAGMSEEQAEAAAADDMDDAVFRYSQPMGFANRSLQELTGDRWKKAFMMFMSDMRLKTALYGEAAKNIVSGKGTTDDVRRIIGVHVLAMLSQVILNWYKDVFDDDDEEDTWNWASIAQAGLLGPIQGFIVLGSAGELVVSKILQGKFYTPTRDPFVDLVVRGERAVRNWEDAVQTEDMGKFRKEWENVFKAIAVHPVTAAPATVINFLKPLFGFYENMEKDEE